MNQVVGTEQVREFPAISKRIQDLEELLLTFDQADCPVEHHFTDGVYSRTLRVPAGTLAIGHRQKYRTLNIFVKGRVIMYDGAGKPGKELVAPYTYISEPFDKKMGYFVEDSEWISVHPNPTGEIDTDKLLDMLLIPEKDFLKMLHNIEEV